MIARLNRIERAWAGFEIAGVYEPARAWMILKRRLGLRPLAGSPADACYNRYGGRLKMTQQVTVLIEKQDADVHRRGLEFESHRIPVQARDIVRVDVAEHDALVRSAGRVPGEGLASSNDDLQGRVKDKACRIRPGCGKDGIDAGGAS